MFAMPTKQRLLVCRLGFVLLCVLPTLAVCLWIVGQSTASPVRHDDGAWRSELPDRLGLIVSCEGHGQIDDETWRLTGVRLLDPETRAVLVQAAQVKARHTSAGWLVEARGAEINAGQLPRLAALLHERLLGAPSENMPRGALLARDVVLRDGNSAHTVSSFAARLAADAAGPQATIDFALAGSPPEAAPQRLAIVRDRSGPSPVTRWQLDTARQTLRCALVAAVMPAAGRLGNEAQFTGLVSCAMEPGGLSGELSGTLDRVDLDTVVTERFAHQLSGQARVQIETARLDGGKLTELRGTLATNGGALSPSLIAAAVAHLDLQAAGDLLADGAAIAFDRLAIRFALDGRLLRLSSLGESAAVLSDGKHPLLAVAPEHAVPAVNLLRVLLPDNEYQVPATRQTDALVGLLPVPDIVPQQTASRVTHTPTRLRSSGPAEAAPVLRQPGLR
jgi:hypothetical protein